MNKLQLLLYELKQILFQKILHPYTHILKASSKERRAKLFKAFNNWLNVPADTFPVLQEMFQVNHFGGLL
jgi:hypothetical protein